MFTLDSEDFIVKEEDGDFRKRIKDDLDERYRQNRSMAISDFISIVFLAAVVATVGILSFTSPPSRYRFVGIPCFLIFFCAMVFLAATRFAVSYRKRFFKDEMVTRCYKHFATSSTQSLVNYFRGDDLSTIVSKGSVIRAELDYTDTKRNLVLRVFYLDETDTTQEKEYILPLQNLDKANAATIYVYAEDVKVILDNETEDVFLTNL